MRNKIREIYDNISQRRFFPFVIRFFVWVGLVLFWWIILQHTVEMPAEYELRHSTDALRREYAEMSERYDSLANIIDNVVRRDENVFRKLFESNPYDLSADFEQERIELFEQLTVLDNDELMAMLDSRMQEAQKKENMVLRSSEQMKQNISNGLLSIDCVPSIQPVNNKQLTLLAAGKKPLINPFHRTMSEHHGVDYLIPEGTPVFATADGRIENISEKNSSEGKTISINHGNGYKTRYAHLLDIRVSEGSVVKRGDIIALSGNSGLSFAPHLHYEVIYKRSHVNPINYFDKNMSAEAYKSLMNQIQDANYEAN